jgi:hypothetical protein
MVEKYKKFIDNLPGYECRVPVHVRYGEVKK